MRQALLTKDRFDIGFILGKKYIHLGDGGFADVFQIRNTRYVIKIFDNDDCGYLNYITWVMQNQHNKYVPKIKGKLVRVSKKVWAVRMEQLSQSTNDQKNKAHAIAEYLYQCAGDWDDIYTPYRDDQDLVDIMKFLVPYWSMIDLHSHNIMNRDGQMVITDPLCA
jgi:hypothetical protein